VREMRHFPTETAPHPRHGTWCRGGRNRAVSLTRTQGKACS
jgi:hypothetical protein